jgi:hypothetical protein
MARIAGVTTHKDEKGNLTHVTINKKKHPEAVEALKGVGLLEKTSLQKEMDVNPGNYRTVDEVFDRLEETVKSWEWEK